MNTKLTTQSKAVTQCVNKTIADDFVRRYQSSTKNALENILCMGEAVYEIYQKTKAGELDQSDLEYFCQSVHLDPKGSTFRKYKAIGENANRFRQHLEKLPSTFSVLYEMATLDADDFELFTKNTTLSKSTTLEEFKQMIRRAHLKNPVQNCYPSNKIIKKAANRIQEIENRFLIDVKKDIKKSELSEILNTLHYFKNKGWIRLEESPVITSEDDADDNEKYFTAFAEQDARELRM